MRFLGVDLAWKEGNPSGVVVLEGTRFPLRLVAAPDTIPTHTAVLDWLAGWLHQTGPAQATTVGIDAPLLGLDCSRGRRDCDDEVSRHFGRFAAPVSSLTAFREMLQQFVGGLESRCPATDFCPETRVTVSRPAIREVYPNALQVRLFDLDRPPVRKKHVYKRHKFASKREWVTRGLGPFVDKCAVAIESRRYIARDRTWKALVRERPRVADPGWALKALEDRWDAILCALAVALEQFSRGSMRAYTGPTPGSWRDGYILAPTLRPASDGRTR